jgi:NAD-specific glutamate dehydrogenase
VAVSLLQKAEQEDEQVVSDYMSLVRQRDVERFREVMEELKAEDSIGLAAVSVATRELADVADRVGREPGQEDRRSGS